MKENPHAVAIKKEAADTKRSMELELKSKFAGLFRCMTFLSPGPPGYAARCRKPRNHDGECDFGPEGSHEWHRRTSAIPLFMDPKDPRFLGLLRIDLQGEIERLRAILADTEHDLKLVIYQLEKNES